MSNQDRPKGSAARRAARLLDSAPVLILAAIAGGGSFVHIRDTAAQHGQHGPMSWAIAICIDLTCVMAAREHQRDKHTGCATRRLSWPTIVLTGGVLLSLAANLDQAQATRPAGYALPVMHGWLACAVRGYGRTSDAGVLRWLVSRSKIDQNDRCDRIK